MTPLNSKTAFYYQLRSIILMSALLVLAASGLSACATTEQTPSAASGTTTPHTSDSAKPTTKTNQAADEVEYIAPIAETSPEPVAKPEPVRIVETCKNEPFSKYEKQARASMAKGLAALQEGKYGVGFRNVAEHKIWSNTHNKLFKSVNNACDALSQCAKQHPKDKTKKCANQASQFKQWQDTAKRFAENAKQSETVQPPKICSFEPNLKDAASCFHGLGDNIDKVCNTPECKEASDCWRGIGFLDYAINQASSACNFVRTPLAECRGYVTATKRRENKFKRCNAMQEQLNITVLPVL